MADAADTDVSVVVTGLVRDVDLFTRSLDCLTGIKQIKEIILATWEKEAAENAATLATLAHRFDLKVVAVPEPPQWSGNLLSQMLSLYVGANHAACGNILKTRTDVFIEPDALKYIFAKDRAISLPGNMTAGTPVFGNKVCVWGVESTSPFYMHDLFFFASKPDMLKLVNMDVRYDCLYNMTKEKVHIRRFIHPFIHEFPILEKFLHVAHVLGATIEFPNEYRYAVLEKMLGEELYVLILALYYRLVDVYFSNDWGQDRVFEWKDVPDQVAFTPGGTLKDAYFAHPGYKALLAKGDVLFRSVAASDFADDELGQRFAKANAELDGLADLRTAGLDHDFNGFIQRALGCGQEALDVVRQSYAEDGVSPAD